MKGKSGGGFLSGMAPIDNRGEQAAAIEKKWHNTGLLKGLVGQHASNMARLLENQAAQLLREANTLGSGTAANSLSFSYGRR